MFAALAALFGLSTLLISCGDNNHQVKLVTKHSLLYIQGTDSLFTGTEEERIQDKTIIYDVVKGKKNGSLKILYSDGDPQIMGTMLNNLNEGHWKYYYPDSKIESEGLFKNDLPEGKWKWYFENGKLMEVGSYHKGKREGRWVHFDISGNITLEKKFKDGEEIKSISDSISAIKARVNK